VIVLDAHDRAFAFFKGACRLELARYVFLKPLILKESLSVVITSAPRDASMHRLSLSIVVVCLQWPLIHSFYRRRIVRVSLRAVDALRYWPAPGKPVTGGLNISAVDDPPSHGPNCSSVKNAGMRRLPIAHRGDMK
jgi:hypothetical protein